MARFGRPENIDAAVWLVTHVWPLVRLTHPDAQPLLVGTSTSTELEQVVRDTPGAVLTGYAPDLSEILGAAWVSVAPIRFGGGVKFKTVESLLAGTPTVATVIGAEGVTPRAALTAIHDDPTLFAAAISSVLDDPVYYATRTLAYQPELQATYGHAAFANRVREIIEEAALARRPGLTSLESACLVPKLGVLLGPVEPEVIMPVQLS